ncbi:hypothetical protein AURDEDRAFT_73359 [Auricularia subglabra TFB-10046 SS5]|uniref:Uncharacterized protein n=1 Tax=Auricularia subglabra (strain TFB-10046 / SS5) TaxID=717982 RepID=J0WUB1_AURST|nr:hypothetical protein AURDEDRAFT_73359 [Auricularia subglabra TFB-10046 SS5]
MPMFAIAQNIAIDGVFGLLLATDPVEKAGFTTWFTLQFGLAYALLAHGGNEWAHAPRVRRHLPAIFILMLAACVAAYWSFAQWWITSQIGLHRGKTYAGRPGPDMMELSFWAALVGQCYLSVASLGQLIIREHSGGVSWAIWATRALGSATGMYAYYAWRWYFWPEAHEYFANPFALLLGVVGLLADAMYPLVFVQVRRTERVQPDGRKLRGNNTSVPSDPKPRSEKIQQ